ncbi:MAG: TonB-dependent receptor family protein [Bacteroidales bacterium]|nr:TonB-dependent receptor family protein [Bacteroidales bacterium]
MKRIFTSMMMAILFSMAAFVCQGQDFGMMNRYRTAKVRVNVVDVKTGNPIDYATVYLCHQGDTVITNFALTDSEGLAVIDEVAQGKYDLNVELLGYVPFKKLVDIKLGDFEREKNLGKIQLERSKEFLDAASVSAAGNPVVVKKDTLVFNANAYRTVENAMLADLLKKMPGIKVGSDGSIKVNGEKVDRLTVGGKTFFQKDPGLAVKSLPAKIVERIQVIDKAKEDAAFTGVGSKEDQEKVMDVMLKDEYQKGWFGNVKVSGGAALNGQNQPEGQSQALFNGNAMVSHYNPTDQVVFLSSAKNATEPGSWSMDDGFGFEVMSGSDLDDLSTKQGLQTTGQAGINYNTTRLKGLESTASLSYNYLRKNVNETSSRQSFQGDFPTIFTNGSIAGISTSNNLSFSGELKNTDKSKYLFTFRPYLMYSGTDGHSKKESSTKTGDAFDNAGMTTTSSHNNNFSLFNELEAGIKDMGKERRSLTLTAESFFDKSLGNSRQTSRIRYKAAEELQDLKYDNRSFMSGHELELSYVEPFGEKWSLQARVAGAYNGNRITKDAFNGADGSVNNNYSSFSKNDDFDVRQRLLLQYKVNETSLLFGFQTNEERNVTTARYLGMETTTGQDDWIFNWAPYVDFVTKNDLTTFRFQYRGRSGTPSGSNIIPALNLGNPVQVSVGNVYLRPQFTHSASASFRTSNPKNYSFLELYLSVSLSRRPIVSANWFDPQGIRYSIPVNSRKPGSDLSLFASFNQPFGKEKNFTFSLDGDISYSSNTGFQTTSRLSPIDKENFDYGTLMDWFWGDSQGNLFYSGKSGFSESTTKTLSYSLIPTLQYKLDNLSLSLMGFAMNSRTRYSLDKTADMNTWDFNITGELLFTTRHSWQFNSDIGYNFYKGYSKGYGEPELIWNAGIAKDVKAFTFSFKVADILVQQKSLHRTTSAEYVEDVNRIVLGRYFLFGVTFYFGRMNAAQSSKVEQAMWEMAF